MNLQQALRPQLILEVSADLYSQPKNPRKEGIFSSIHVRKFFFASQMKCWLHDCCIFYFIVQQKIKHSYISYYYFAIQYLRGSSYFKDTKSLHYYICFFNQNTYLEYFHYKIQLISSMLNCAWLIYQTMCINVKKDFGNSMEIIISSIVCT